METFKDSKKHSHGCIGSHTEETRMDSKHLLKGQQIEGDWLTSPVFWVRITCVTSKKQKHLLRLKENIVIQFKEKQRKSSKNIGYFLHVQYTA